MRSPTSRNSGVPTHLLPGRPPTGPDELYTKKMIKTSFKTGIFRRLTLTLAVVKRDVVQRKAAVRRLALDLDLFKNGQSSELYRLRSRDLP